MIAYALPYRLRDYGLMLRGVKLNRQNASQGY
jgi:hypothetical protein